MTLLVIPHFFGGCTPEIESKVNEIYSETFLNGIYESLRISNKHKQGNFEKFIKSVSVSYLTAKKINAGRIPPSKQKELFKKYASVLRNTKRLYNEIISHNTTSAHFHDAVREEIRKSEVQGIEGMFDPYVSQGGLATTIFDEFLAILEEGAKKAPNYISETDKADLNKEYVLWWLHKVGSSWNSFTSVPFTLGDWFKNEEIGMNEPDNPNKKGLYFSPSIDILHMLLSAVDKKIRRADIETAMRKLKKMKLYQ